MNDPTDRNDSTDFDGHTHYFYDSNGHMYVDLSAVCERGCIEIVPIGTGEIQIPISEVRVETERPVVNFAISSDGDQQLRDAYTEILE